MGYIYKITNKINNKSYIGKTERSVQVRWKEHCRHIDALQHLPLYRTLKKYGLDNFTLETLEECKNEILDDREIYWINYYQSYGKMGYNCTGGGEGGIKTYDEEIEIIAQRFLAGERLDLLCKEFQHGYNQVKDRLEKVGITVNVNAGPQKLSKQIQAIDPNTNKVVAVYPSISEAARAICPEGHNPRAIANHISKQKNTCHICHGFIWKLI